jgi:hypothetical protein
MHALAAVGDPLRQHRVRHGLARDDVLVDPLRDLLPARGLPRLERPHLPAEAPAHGEVEVACAVRDVAEVHAQ